MQDIKADRVRDFVFSRIGNKILLTLNFLIACGAVWAILMADAPAPIHWTDDFILALELGWTSPERLPVQLAKLSMVAEIGASNLKTWLAASFICAFFVASMLDLREGRLKNVIKIIVLVSGILLIGVAVGSIFLVHNTALNSTIGDASEHPTFFRFAGTRKYLSISPVNLLETVTASVMANMGIGLFLTLSTLALEIARRGHLRSRSIPST